MAPPYNHVCLNKCVGGIQSDVLMKNYYETYEKSEPLGRCFFTIGFPSYASKSANILLNLEQSTR